MLDLLEPPFKKITRDFQARAGLKRHDILTPEDMAAPRKKPAPGRTSVPCVSGKRRRAAELAIWIHRGRTCSASLRPPTGRPRGRRWPAPGYNPGRHPSWRSACTSLRPAARTSRPPAGQNQARLKSTLRCGQNRNRPLNGRATAFFLMCHPVQGLRRFEAGDRGGEPVLKKKLESSQKDRGFPELKRGPRNRLHGAAIPSSTLETPR